MTPALILLAVALLLAAAVTKPHWRKWWYRNDIKVPAPAVPRKDLLFGYYSCMDDQVAETRGHINLFMESQFNGPYKAIENIRAADAACMLDVSFQVFAKEKPGLLTVRVDAQERLTSFFISLMQSQALHKVKYLYPVDEPNNTVASLAELEVAVLLIRKVASLFPELSGAKLAVIYAADKPFHGQAMYDLIGFNDYDMKSSVLTGKKYRELKDSLLPHQRTMIIPGGAYGQDPQPFINFAHANPEVAVVMPFLWFDDTTGNVGAKGIRSNGMKDAYINAGKSVI